MQLKILHIGNIANNAYLNAKLLNKFGYKNDVIVFDYYHIMGCPEWEDVDFDSAKIDQFLPAWGEAGFKYGKRASWFYQGPKLLLLSYLLSNGIKKKLYDYLLKRLVYFPKTENILYNIVKCILSIKAFSKIQNKINIFNNTSKDYKKFIGIEKDKLTALLNRYDIIIGYGVDGLYPYLADKKPYIAYEHGTLRQIPFEGGNWSEICKKVYRNANHVLITNCDNNLPAQRLGIKNYSFIPHPVNEDFILNNQSKCEIKKMLYKKYNTDFIVFHPPRQHWTLQKDLSLEKGNDIFIKGFAEFVKKINTRAMAILIDWGQSVNETRQLIKDLDIESNIAWLDPQPNIRMVRLLAGSDVLADQFYLGAFGSITPKGLLHGCPVMLYLDEQKHQWCFPDMPPVLNTRNTSDVKTLLEKIYLDSNFRDRLIHAGKRWYLQYHSNKVIAKKFDVIFKDKSMKLENMFVNDRKKDLIAIE